MHAAVKANNSTRAEGIVKIPYTSPIHRQSILQKQIQLLQCRASHSSTMLAVSSSCYCHNLHNDCNKKFQCLQKVPQSAVVRKHNNEGKKSSPSGVFVYIITFTPWLDIIPEMNFFIASTQLCTKSQLAQRLFVRRPACRATLSGAAATLCKQVNTNGLAGKFYKDIKIKPTAEVALFFCRPTHFLVWANI